MTDPRRTVALKLAGRSYRVVTNASEEEIRRLSGVVESRIEAISKGRPTGPEVLLLAAISLAHDAEQQRQQVLELRARSRETVGRLLGRVDQALASADAADPEREPEGEGASP